MPDKDILRVVMTDADHPRFSIPHDVVWRWDGSPNMRLEMLGV